MKRGGVVLVVVVVAALVWRVTRAEAPREAPTRLLFRKQLPDWEVARSRGAGGVQFKALQTAAASWPGLQSAFVELDDAWPDEDAVTAASARINLAARDAGLDYWVDPVFPGKATVVTTYEVLERVSWHVADAGESVEALHVRRLDSLNVELALLGHASGSQPAVLRDRIEVSVLERLRLDADERPNQVDTLVDSLWRAQLAKVVDSAGLAEAERRVNLREQLLREMEKRLKGGRVHVERPQRLVFGEDYFDQLEPLTSNRRRGGPLLLGSDLRALRAADAALGESVELATLVAVIDLEARVVEAHEVRHALDRRELEVPAYLQRLVGEGDVRFGRMSERELRAFIGQLHDAPAAGCFTVLSLAQLARGRNAQSTPHFFAAHALLATLADVDAPRGLSAERVVEVTTSLCALPDAELRARAAAAMVTLYGVELVPLVQGEVPR